MYRSMGLIIAASVALSVALLGPGSGTSVQAQPNQMSFFVTSVGPGDGANLGGLFGADQHCQNLANAAGAGHRTWRAYLSTQAPALNDPKAVDARDRIGTGPWHNAKGVMIARNVAFQAVQAGYSAIFTTAAELIERLQGDLSPTTFRRKLGRYASCQLLCIDEVGYLAYDAHAADLLYKVVDRRYEKHSVLLTTNLAFRDWNTVFPNATSIATLLDKLTHHADVTLIEGLSYRVHESQKEAAARRKKS